jgi:uncharacterized paraquat-inducible protein A
MVYKCYSCDFEVESDHFCACPRCGWTMHPKTDNKELEQEYRDTIKEVIRLQSFSKYVWRSK